MSTSNSTNPTTAKHQLVSPEGFLRPVDVPEGVTKLVIHVGGDKEKLEAILRVCEEINSIKSCTDLGTLTHMIRFSPQNVKYLIFNCRKDKTFTYLSKVGYYEMTIKKEAYYEVSYDLLIGKLKWAEESLLFQRHLDEVFGK